VCRIHVRDRRTATAPTSSDQWCCLVRTHVPRGILDVSMRGRRVQTAKRRRPTATTATTVDRARALQLRHPPASSTPKLRRASRRHEPNT